MKEEPTKKTFLKQVVNVEVLKSLIKTPLGIFVFLLLVAEIPLCTVYYFAIKNGASEASQLVVIVLIFTLAVIAIITFLVLVIKVPKHLIYDKEAYLIEQSFGSESNELKYQEFQSIARIESPKVITDKTKNEGDSDA